MIVGSVHDRTEQRKTDHRPVSVNNCDIGSGRSEEGRTSGQMDEGEP